LTSDHTKWLNNRRRRTKIDLEELALEIRHLNRHKALYRLLRDELSKRGWWKMRARGDPKKANASRKTKKYLFPKKEPKQS
jgi:hypothetical protein